MTPQMLESARRESGLTQAQAAKRLGLSQPYLSQLERGRRPVTPTVARAAARAFHLRPTALPVAAEPNPSTRSLAGFAKLLAALEYPGYTHLRKPAKKLNPAEVVLRALSEDNLDARVMAALPWVLLHYHDLDWDWLVRHVKVRNLQNRLGFLVALAREVASRSAHESELHSNLLTVEEDLERARLVASTTLCREAMPAVERKWLVENRSNLARHWNVLTSLVSESLPHVT